MGKVILVLGIIAILGGGAYVLWGNESSFKVSFLDSLPGKHAINETSSSTALSTTSPATEFLQDTGAKITSWLGSAAQSFVSSVFDTVKSEITDTVKETAQNALQSVEEQLGITNDSSSTNFAISYVTKVGTQTLFVVKNTLSMNATGTLSYTVEWGDDTRDSQQSVPVRESYAFSHTWDYAGDYDITFRFMYNEKESISNTRVQVKE